MWRASKSTVCSWDCWRARHIRRARGKGSGHAHTHTHTHTRRNIETSTPHAVTTHCQHSICGTCVCVRVFVCMCERCLGSMGCACALGPANRFPRTNTIEIESNRRYPATPGVRKVRVLIFGREHVVLHLPHLQHAALVRVRPARRPASRQATPRLGLC